MEKLISLYIISLKASEPINDIKRGLTVHAEEKIDSRDLTDVDKQLIVIQYRE